MRLSTLLSALCDTPVPDCEIRNVTDDTRKAKSNSLFVCVRGARFDGHALAIRAYENGCRCFLAEHPLNLPKDALVTLTQNTRHALSLLACAFFDHPSKKMKVIGVTGTKGKTTTAQLIRGILQKNGIPTGYIGTNGILYGNVKLHTDNTTPHPLVLQQTLSDMYEHGMQAVIIEVSSQAILQSRVDGMAFEGAVFTNLSLDHVGPTEHESFENYKECKHRLFTDFGIKTAVWNADDPHHREMMMGCVAKHNVFYATLNGDADFRGTDILPCQSSQALGIAFSVCHKNESFHATLPLVGLCNVSNALSAIAVACEMFGITPQKSAASLIDLRVDGRSECYPLPSGAMAVIDYAHNEESLRSILTALRAYTPSRLLCLFGSVGERSQLRRRALGSVASELADFSVITSDNPGNEPPCNIINEIAEAFPSDTAYKKIPDRKDAIAYAVHIANKGDILLLAGKGHETYQQIGIEKISFDERQILCELSAPQKSATD